MFAYNLGDPLDIKYISHTKQDNAWIHDITFASPKGGRVTAFLVTPTTEGRHPAFIFAHSGGSNRREFLPEALLFAEAGAVSLLIDDPTARPEQWRRQIFDFNNPEQAHEGFIQAIIDLRRCVDLLVGRPDVDPQRIGYVGFSFGSTQGGILCGIERRISAYALMGGGLRLTEFFLNRITDQPGLDEYIQAIEPFNVEYYIVHSPPAEVLYQFGTEDRNVSKEKALGFYKTGPIPKDIRWWNGGHIINGEATYQRIEWFHEKLGTKLLVKGPATGTWTGTLDGPDGNPLEVTYVFDAIGNMLLGTVNTRLGGGPFEEGKIEGNKISFISRPGPSTIIEMTGTLSGDVINMTRKKGDEVDEFKLKRVRENKRFDGTWKGTVPGADGTPLEITYEFESSGNNLSGTVTTKMGEGPFDGGKIEGNNISFTVPIPDMTVYVNGTLSGDVINMVQKKGDEVNEFTLRCVTAGTDTTAAALLSPDDQAQKIEEGKRMWEKWIAARGGRDRLSKIKEIKSTSEMTIQGINSAVTHYFKGTDKYRVDEKVMGRTSIRVVDGAKGWMTDDNTGLSVDMPARARDQFLSEKEKHEELLNPEQFGHTITYAGRKTVDGKEYILLKQDAGNGVITIHYIDPDTFLRYKFTLSLFPGLEIITSDYRDVDGTKVPFSTLLLRNGIEVGTRTVVGYLYDCGLDDSLFAKP